jgi:hypothetical protein
MQRRSGAPEKIRQRIVEAVATLAALLHAHARGDAATAALAQHTLDRMGVVVILTQSWRPAVQAEGCAPDA